MRNIGLLLKNNFLMFVGTLQKKNKKPFIAAVSTIFAVGIGVLVIYFYQASTMYKGLGNLVGNSMCLFHGILTCLTVLIILSVLRSTSAKKTNDSDLLLSMPIKKSEIVLSKIINKYLFDLLFTILLLSPYTILYLVYEEFTILVMLRSALCVLLLPAMSVGIGLLMDFFTNKILNKSKYSSLYKSIISIVIFVLVMGLMLLKTFTYGSAKPDSLVDYYNDRFFTYQFLKFIIKPDALSIVIVLSLLIIPFVLGVFSYAFNFGKTFLSYMAKSDKVKYGQSKSELGGLLKKEINGYVSTPTYIVNTIIGAIFMLAFGILLLSVGGDIFSVYSLSLDKKTVFGIAVAIFLMFTSMSAISASSISLEGKQIWILKSTPINEKRILTAKALVNIIFVAPFIIVGGIFVGIALELNIGYTLLLIVLTLMYNVVVAYGGLLINLIFPKLEWSDEAQVVKQSLASMLAMFGGMIISVIPMMLFLFADMSIGVLLITTGVTILAMMVASIIAVYTYGVKKFRSINI